MVTTRRVAAATASSSQTGDQSSDASTTTRGMRKVRKTAKTATESQPKKQTVSTTTTSASSFTTKAATTVATTTTTTARRTRSKTTDSPLKQLGDEANNVQKPLSRAKQQSKRKRDTPHYHIPSASATPEPESVQSESVRSVSVQDENDDEQGIFFTQNGQPSQSPSLMSNPFRAELEGLHEENVNLRDRITQLEKHNEDLVKRNNFLLDRCDELSAGQAMANPQLVPDFPDLNAMHNNVNRQSPKPEFVTGNPAALALLAHIEKSAREMAVVECESQINGTPSSQTPQSVNNKRKSIDSKPAPTPRPMASSNFFSRSISAIKSKLGFSAAAPQQEPASPTPVPSNAPPADTFTEALSAPPTPVGERSKAPPKKQKQSPMLRLLLKGVEDGDKARAEKWAKDAIPALKNDKDFAAKRKRLETPVQLQDLKTFPSCKPWESGFGDPLGELDDEDVVPVWAVYLEILEEDKDRKKKRRKSSHQQETMDVEDTPSLNDLFAASEGSPSSSKMRDSHGQSASLVDLHPRRSVEPSPLFDSPVSHQKGKNIFKEHQGQEASAELRESKLEALHQATKNAAPKHDPSQGSFGLDDDFDDDDSTIISETNEPAWTQAPPPAPVPAHAPLPAGATAESTSSSEGAAGTSEEPVNEVERQRQKLMKFTPAKPSRLREAFVPSPSLLSDAGNESILMKTPLTAGAAVTNPYDDMPEPEDLGLTEEDMENLRALQADPVWQAADAANIWPDPIMTYDSAEEDLSPE